MSKDKLSWTIAMVLTALLSLPIAFAQSFTGSRISYILINAVVIGIILFILQAILIPGKPDKERVSAWVIVIIASLAISYLYGQEGLIWRTGAIGAFFAVYTWYVVLVNAAIIGIVLYFLLGLLLKDKVPKSTEGMTGYGILIFIISLIAAVKLINPALPVAQQWVWAQPTISTLINFFFGNEGILTTNQNRIFIFIFTGVLLLTFFNFVGLGKESKWISPALAFIFAANLASGPDPLTFAGVKNLVLIIGTWILGSNLSSQFTVGKYKPIAYVIAFLLMMWAVSSVETAVTPEGRAAVAANGGGVTGWIWGWVTTLLSSKGLWILGGIILLLFFVIFRGETRRRILTLGVAGLFKRLNSILRWTDLKRSAPKGREPQIFKENRLLLMACSNYTTRSEITYRYLRGVETGLEHGREIVPKIGKFWDYKKLRHDLIAYRSGDGITYETMEGTKPIGWNRLNLELIDILNRYFKLITRTYISAHFKFKAAAKFKSEASEVKALESEVTELATRLHEAIEHYKLREEAFRYHHILNGYRLIALNMFNVTGEFYENPLKFAKPGAEFEYGPEYFKNEELVGGKKIEGGIEVPTTQVNQYGEYVEDIWPQKDKITGGLDVKTYKKPRKLKNPEEIVDYPDYLTLMRWITLDWGGLAEDIRYGLHHPKSRTFKAYEHAILKKMYPEYADEKIQSIGAPTKADQSFDMRALANVGLNRYWGRRWYYGQTLPPGPNTIPPENPFPNISSGGIKHYLQTRIEQDMKDKELAHRFMSKIPADTMVPRKEYRGKEVIAKVGGTLAQKSAGEKTS